jgi:hypothetical protein
MNIGYLPKGFYPVEKPIGQTWRPLAASETHGQFQSHQQEIDHDSLFWNAA